MNVEKSSTLANSRPVRTEIKKIQRTVKVPTTDIAPYIIGTKKTPAFIDLETNDQSFNISLNDWKQVAQKNDLAYDLTKTICAVNETPLPGWTGFNTMLDNKKHDISKVGYLPVINASPTEYSTINAILTRSKEIADKLQLKYTVLVFDEAVYSKIYYTQDIVRSNAVATILCVFDQLDEVKQERFVSFMEEMSNSLPERFHEHREPSYGRNPQPIPRLHFGVVKKNIKMAGKTVR